MKKTGKIVTLLLSLAIAFSFAVTVRVGKTDRITALADGEIDVTESVSFVETSDNQAYQNAYGVSSIHLVIGSYSLVPADGGVAYYVNDNPSKNGVDPAEYVLINGKTVRSVLTENAASNTYVHTSGDLFPMSVGGCYAPILVFVNTHIELKIMKEYAAFNSFSLTLKAGFAWKLASGETLKTTKDVTYLYYGGSFLPKKSEVDLKGSFSLRESSVPTADSVIYTVDAASNFFTDSNWLMDHYTELQNYVTVNGKTVAEINAGTDDSSYVYTEFPGSIGGVYAVPVRLHFGTENGKTRLNVYIHNDYLTANPAATIGLKAGFGTYDDKNEYTLSEDCEFRVPYLLVFEKKDGTQETRYVPNGSAVELIGLPAVPDGYTSAWVADAEYSVMPVGNVTYRETYYPIEYAVVFMDGETELGRDTYTVENKSVTPPELPTKEHYQSAWEEYELTFGDKTVSVVYTAIAYKVTFVADGKTVATVTYTVENTNVTAPEVPEKAGYTAVWEEYDLTFGEEIVVNAVYTETEEPESASESGNEGESASVPETEESDSTLSASEGKASGCMGSLSTGSFALMLISAMPLLFRKKKD